MFLALLFLALLLRALLFLALLLLALLFLALLFLALLRVVLFRCIRRGLLSQALRFSFQRFAQLLARVTRLVWLLGVLRALALRGVLFRPLGLRCLLVVLLWVVGLLRLLGTRLAGRGLILRLQPLGQTVQLVRQTLPLLGRHPLGLFQQLPGRLAGAFQVSVAQTLGQIAGLLKLIRIELVQTLIEPSGSFFGGNRHTLAFLGLAFQLGRGLGEGFLGVLLALRQRPLQLLEGSQRALVGLFGRVRVLWLRGCFLDHGGERLARFAQTFRREFA